MGPVPVFWLAPADYCNYSSSGVVLYVGGYYNQSRSRGPFYLNGNYAASNYNTNIGSRLLVEARISILFLAQVFAHRLVKILS